MKATKLLDKFIEANTVIEDLSTDDDEEEEEPDYADKASSKRTKHNELSDIIEGVRLLSTSTMPLSLPEMKGPIRYKRSGGRFIATTEEEERERLLKVREREQRKLNKKKEKKAKKDKTKSKKRKRDSSVESSSSSSSESSSSSSTSSSSSSDDDSSDESEEELKIRTEGIAVSYNIQTRQFTATGS